MISKQDLKSYDFESLQDYFDYVIDSEINGQRSQVRRLINDLSKGQKREFLYYFDNLDINQPDIKTVYNILREVI